MGMLSRLPFGWSGMGLFPQQQQTPPWITPFDPSLGQPPQGNMPGPPIVMPQADATKPASPQGNSWMNGLNAAFESPLWALGTSLMSASEDGGDLRQFAAGMQQYGQQQMARRRMQNEERRQESQDKRDATTWERQQQEWGRDDTQRQRYTDWAAQRGGSATVNPEAAYAASMEAEALANQPVTPFQQAQLDLQRQGLAIDRLRAEREPQEEWIPRGADLVTMRNLQAGAEQAMEAQYLLDQFDAANRRTGTGGGSQWLPWHGFSADRANMAQISSLIQTMTAPQGQGAVSNMERDLFRQAAPSLDLTGNQNHARIQTARDLMDFRLARQAFYSEYGRQNRTLNGAEQAFQQSPQFNAIAVRVRDRSGQGPQQAAGTQPQAQTGQSFDTLPPARNYREGQRITDTQTRRQFVIRNGQWVPVAAQQDNSRRDSNGNYMLR